MRSSVGKIFRYLTAGSLCLAVVLAVASPAGARPWKTTPKGESLDYSQIFDDRGKGDIVMVWWFVPQIIDNSPAASQVLDKYVVIGVVHGHMAPEGKMTFDTVAGIQAKDGDSKPLALLTGDAIPPTVEGMLVGMESALRQMIGAMGQGIQWYVFDSGNVHACSKGGMSVLFAGETYTYATPIPGCAG